MLALFGQVEGSRAAVLAHLPGKDLVKLPEGPFQPGAVDVLRPDDKGDGPKQVHGLLIRKGDHGLLPGHLQFRQGGQGPEKALRHGVQIQHRLGQPREALLQTQVVQRRPAVLFPLRQQRPVLL